MKIKVAPKKKVNIETSPTQTKIIFGRKISAKKSRNVAQKNSSPDRRTANFQPTFSPRANIFPIINSPDLSRVQSLD